MARCTSISLQAHFSDRTIIRYKVLCCWQELEMRCASINVQSEITLVKERL